MSEPRRTIFSPAQLRALASPARQEILDLLARTGPASAADLGRLLQRPADGLYYHLRALERPGLVRAAGSRTRAGRNEALYRCVPREPALRHDVSPDGNSTAVTAIVASMLRLGIRDFRKAALSGAVRTNGARRDLWALRVAGTPEGQAVEKPRPVEGFAPPHPRPAGA
jgi:DNA-binding transcriptional ArsR family regulator